VQVADWAGGVTVYTYTAAGRLSGIWLPNGVETRYGYNAAGRLMLLNTSTPKAGCWPVTRTPWTPWATAPR
jgi:uncharacterized protein RhaS with RHS repeats